ncbi:histidine phosphatase family protein [Pseudomonas sp. GD04087]|uniref:lipopolysaccharide core heptose(II)-phosphate phosphatase PmrG n=1 Tax=Pseudomonas TaxID=286 RepID=UPI00244B1B76|nr:MULTISPECIES: histidine phosphatase family protein [Pseudomonas]MCP1649701.1 phosphohistidine phosphatase SixA [Pseudomonas nitroreducens]MCP1687571.1 phosphohistidine phosphatase SixA [Pseudomonas nitroreducens]MDH0292989.1 histidine phosphatase family protein [Pseudomonas sp. GD04087]MDH1052155.1 histidine phosphatase family protein [Pseudomonas sp. GD03903]MDH2003312.1 histidine phosphatase family protein [Pseudomonas sp. GD03691]
MPRLRLLAVSLLTCTTLALVAWRALPSPLEDVPSSSLFAHNWARGGVVLLVRHMERCDRSSAQCLGAADGITARAAALAQSMGDSITRLGLSATDIYSSPANRTAQTADLMFDQPIARQDWLLTCKDGDLATQIREHKAAHRNLVLVTHSECFDLLRENLKVRETDTPEYGSALVLFDESAPKLRIAGEVETDEWLQLLGSHNPS